MKNFLRALRFAWPYRGRLVFSIFCALLVALLWGANFMAISPTLEILSTKSNLQTIVTKWIAEKEQQIQQDEKALAAKKKEAEQVEANWPEHKNKQRHLAELNIKVSDIEARLSHARWQLGWYTSVQIYVNRLCPEDPFETLVWLLALVVASVALKGVFEFFQESLVGSVVNLSVMDIRNRFYRNVIHLDVNQFTDDGTHELMARFTNDMESLGTGTKTLFGKMVAEPLKAVSCVVFACIISWRLTLLFLILVPIAIIIMSKVGMYTKRDGW